MQGNCNSPDWWLLKSAGVAGRKYDQALCATGNRYGDRRLSAVMRGTIRLSDLCPTEGVRHIVVAAATAEKHQRHQPATD